MVVYAVWWLVLWGKPSSCWVPVGVCCSQLVVTLPNSVQKSLVSLANAPQITGRPWDNVTDPVRSEEERGTPLPPPPHLQPRDNPARLRHGSLCLWPHPHPHKSKLTTPLRHRDAYSYHTKCTLWLRVAASSCFYMSLVSFTVNVPFLK